MTYAFQEQDYIRFHRIVRPESKCRFRTDYKTGRPIAIPSIPEQVLPQSGEGQIVKLAKSKRKVDGETFTVARVAAGSHLGVVTAILDDAELVAKPLTMDLGIEATDSSPTHNVYSSDAKGIS